MDDLAADARETVALLKSMHDTLRKARQELRVFFEELEKIKGE